MTTTERQPIRWLTQSKDFYRSACGRFDIVTTPASGAWVVYDCDCPKRHDAKTLNEAKAWCETRAATKLLNG